jgi:hypothetical protein
VVKPRHLIAIVAIGAGLVLFAPITEKAEESDKTEIAAKPADDVSVIPAKGQPAEDAKLSRASFDGQTEKLKDTNN